MDFRKKFVKIFLWKWFWN